MTWVQHVVRTADEKSTQNFSWKTRSEEIIQETYE